jgi:transcriptional regulator with XRE-family HTH domain
VCRELKINFGRRIRFLRRYRDITQGQLAEQIGRSINFVNMLEHGQTAALFDTLERLAKALNVEVVELFHFDKKHILMGFNSQRRYMSS